MLEELSEGRTRPICGILGLLSFLNVAARDGFAQRSLRFRRTVKSGFTRAVEPVGPDPPSSRSGLSRNPAGFGFVFFDGESDSFGGRVLGRISGLGNLDALPISVPTAEEYVAPAYASVPLPLENASSHSQPAARLMTVTSNSPEQQV
jgi:hypothetical protein